MYEASVIKYGELAQGESWGSMGMLLHPIFIVPMSPQPGGAAPPGCSFSPPGPSQVLPSLWEGI